VAGKLDNRNAGERAQRLAEAEKVGAVAQRKLGVALPQEVKEFLVVQGDRSPNWGGFPWPALGGRYGAAPSLISWPRRVRCTAAWRY
jgi:hypothetical protein